MCYIKERNLPENTFDVLCTLYHRRMGHGFRFFLTLFSTPFFQNFHINHSFYKIFIIIRFSSFDNISRRHTSWIIHVFCVHSFSTDRENVSNSIFIFRAISLTSVGKPPWFFFTLFTLSTYGTVVSNCS